MPGFLARVLITAFGLWVADVALAGVWFDGWQALFVAAPMLISDKTLSKCFIIRGRQTDSRNLM